MYANGWGLHSDGATVDLAAMRAWWITLAFWLCPPERWILHIPCSFCMSSPLESSSELLAEKQVVRDLCNPSATATVQKKGAKYTMELTWNDYFCNHSLLISPSSAFQRRQRTLFLAAVSRHTLNSHNLIWCSLKLKVKHVKQPCFHTQLVR